MWRKWKHLITMGWKFQKWQTCQKWQTYLVCLLSIKLSIWQSLCQVWQTSDRKIENLVQGTVNFAQLRKNSLFVSKLFVKEKKKKKQIYRRIYLWTIQKKLKSFSGAPGRPRDIISHWNGDSWKKGDSNWSNSENLFFLGELLASCWVLEVPSILIAEFWFYHNLLSFQLNCWIVPLTGCMISDIDCVSTVPYCAINCKRASCLFTLVILTSQDV